MSLALGPGKWVLRMKRRGPAFAGPVGHGTPAEERKGAEGRGGGLGRGGEGADARDRGMGLGGGGGQGVERGVLGGGANRVTKGGGRG